MYTVPFFPTVKMTPLTIMTKLIGHEILDEVEYRGYTHVEGAVGGGYPIILPTSTQFTAEEAVTRCNKMERCVAFDYEGRIGDFFDQKTKPAITFYGVPKEDIGKGGHIDGKLKSADIDEDMVKGKRVLGYSTWVRPARGMYKYVPGRVDKNKYAIIPQANAAEQYGTVNEAMAACNGNPSCWGLGYKGPKSKLGEPEYDMETPPDIQLYRSTTTADTNGDPTWSTWVRPVTGIVHGEAHESKKDG